MVDNVLRIAFKGKTSIESKPLYQYDYGQIIKFIDLELPSSYEVHFSNFLKGDSIAKLGTINGVDIPNELLQTGLPIYVWVYLHVGQYDGETEYMVTIPIIQRAGIGEEQPTEYQENIIGQTIQALNSAVGTLSSYVEDTKDAAGQVATDRIYINYYMQQGRLAFDGAVAAASNAVEAASHYPIISNGEWQIWNTRNREYIGTDISAQGSKGDPFTYEDFTPAQLSALVGPSGKDGKGVPSGGSTGQVLKKSSNVDYDTEWFDVITNEIDPTVPSWAKEPTKPNYTADEVGAIAIPSVASEGAFLIYNGTNWVAQSFAIWSGGDY